ncbi:MAG: FAD-binding oxidoreductase [Lautropia sp.]|nr:FAD-binding oxidoreductase [Lautropia sp.]
MTIDTIVLGAGIVGVCTALHLQQRGQRVALVDQQEPGQGTSFGNAGLIERASVIPYAMPYSIPTLLRYAGNRQPDVRFQWRAMPGLAPWLWRYWRESSPANLARAADDMRPLIERCTAEHAPLIQAAGLNHLVRQSGWMDIYRDPLAFTRAAADARTLIGPYQLKADVLDGQALKAREPGFLPDSNMAGAIHWLDPWTVSAPGDLVKGYAELFVRQGGRFIRADARRLSHLGDTAARPDEQTNWTLPTDEGELRARHVVIALGPDAGDVYRPLGYRLPLVHKRGYHLHFKPQADQPVPVVPMCDSKGGFVLSAMKDGVRLTTGVSLTRPDAPPERTQLTLAERIARQYWPLGTAVEAEPWMGRRPCTPDMRPIIGPAARHRGLWFNFGHAHHGLTLGAASGRLLAEMMTGETPFTNPAPYSANRFDA